MAKLNLILGTPILVLGAVGAYLLSDRTDNAVSLESGGLVSNSELYRDLRLTQRKGDSILKGVSDYISNHSHIEKFVSESEARARIQKIKDYSVKITTKCGAGTGWFLDYEIPSNGGYPTKWFVATNAHVISDFKFRDNPYNQVLPIGNASVDQARACVRRGEDSTQLVLFKDTAEWNDEISKVLDYPEVWSIPELKDMFYPSGSVYAKNAARPDWGSLENIKLVYAEVKDPKLFYAPIDFLGQKYEKLNSLWWTSSNYYKDFAVLEVNFDSEEVARRITNNFYDAGNTKHQLDFFKDELLKGKNANELAANPDSYFVAGYPGNSYNQYKAFGNYSINRQRASQLVSWNAHASEGRGDEFFMRNVYGQKILGHADVGKLDKETKTTTIVWNGKRYYNWGYNYVLDNMRLGPGASGSLVTNKDGSVLGLYRMHNDSRSHGFVEPLRSEGYYRGSTIVYPKYDLIKGSAGQISSYKQQLDTYFPSINTHLRNIWNKKS